jgi:hypothetical protein
MPVCCVLPTPAIHSRRVCESGPLRRLPFPSHVLQIMDHDHRPPTLTMQGAGVAVAPPVQLLDVPLQRRHAALIPVLHHQVPHTVQPRRSLVGLKMHGAYTFGTPGWREPAMPEHALRRWKTVPHMMLPVGMYTMYICPDLSDTSYVYPPVSLSYQCSTDVTFPLSICRQARSAIMRELSRVASRTTSSMMVQSCESTFGQGTRLDDFCTPETPSLAKSDHG